jgi:membrane protease YdiL (CAAX protease family)
MDYKLLGKSILNCLAIVFLVAVIINLIVFVLNQFSAIGLAMILFIALFALMVTIEYGRQKFDKKFEKHIKK